MATNIVEKIVDIPDGVNLNLDGRKVIVSGEKGQVIKDFTHAHVNLVKQEGNLRIYAINPKKKQSALVGTLAAHVGNMVKGVTQGFTYKLKIVFVHFPMTVRLQGKKIVIQNFIGERKSREAKIQGNVQVSIQGEDIIVEGIDLHDVAQTAANIQQATKIREKDLRKFLDGIYVYSKE
jgi:large subunit ribosomal protein L6